jgi:hypothetical protein
MPHTSKKRSSVGARNYLVRPPARRSRRIAGRLNADFDDLDDVLADILEFLPIKEIMCDRRVSKKWGEMIKKVVPHGDISVTNMDDEKAVRLRIMTARMRAKGMSLAHNNVISHGTMRVMTTEMPNLQHIALRPYGKEHKYSDGEDPDGEQAARTADYTTLDLEIISNFSMLKSLAISNIGLNGSYPFLFNSFPLLQKLSIGYCEYLKWDLEMLSGFPLLEELQVSGNNRLTGNIRSLRVLKDTLETLTITTCANVVEGNLMDLADFPQLKALNLYNTAVTGDVRDIGENDFTNLEKLRFPFGVVGGMGFKFQRVADAPSVVNAYYRLAKRAKPLCDYDGCSYYSWWLSEQSPDYYATEDLVPPHYISFVKVGSRLGWRWTTPQYLLAQTHSCEINWLDPEPDREGDGYEAYVKELASIQEEINVYQGYYQPPTEEEYMRLCREYAEN